MTQYNKAGRATVVREVQGLAALMRFFPESFADCISLILNRKGHVAVTGMGKSGHIAKKIAATFASTGTPAFFIHPAEALHGDLGMVRSQDCILALSNSGETKELQGILEYAAQHSLPVIAMTAEPQSTLAMQADLVLLLPRAKEACPLGCAPTTSTTQMLVLGDALAMTLLEARGFSAEDFNTFHPGGHLGKRLMRVREIMHVGDAIPFVSHTATMGEAILEISKKRMGCTGVVQGKRLIGIITDGDLRRHMMPDLLLQPVTTIMTSSPRAISENIAVAKALGLMQQHKITNLFVVDVEGQVKGILHLHDCLHVSSLK